MDKIKRCTWAKNKVYIDYHDNYWCKKLTDENALFELLILESQSVGLSFWQVWDKRDEYNKYFDFKNIKNIISINDAYIDSLLTNSNLIKNRNKLHSIILNAKAYFKLINDYTSLSEFIWNNPLWKNEINKTNKTSTIENSTSKLMSKILKKYGFKFVGSITIFSYLQAIGFYNDHQKDCFMYHKN